jgi:hypothetical protein
MHTSGTEFSSLLNSPHVRLCIVTIAPTPKTFLP